MFTLQPIMQPIMEPLGQVWGVKGNGIKKT